MTRTRSAPHAARPADAPPGCRQCGDCCHFEIPVTLPDLERIAGHLGCDLEAAYRRALAPAVSARSGLFMMRKREDRACVFLDAERRCGIHPAKPRTCEFYLCSRGDPERDRLPWTAHCGQPRGQARLWDHSVATMLTRAYTREHGARWVARDVQRLLRSYHENSSGEGARRIKLTRDRGGGPVAVIYDCEHCEEHGARAVETPVTLDDVARLMDHLGLDGGRFFATLIAARPSELAGGLQLERDGHCLLYEPERGCTVEAVRPLHCRFVPCPLRVREGELADRLFLGSGTVEQQFRHQVAMAVTREYVERHGTGYHRGAFRRHLRRIDELCDDRVAFAEFCDRIADCRFVDDTLPLLRGEGAAR